MLGADSDNQAVSALGSGAAKMAGYAWEGLGGPQNWKSEDARHDLNANAVGAYDATTVKGRDAVKRRLLERAALARESSPPGIAEESPGYFTYTKK